MLGQMYRNWQKCDTWSDSVIL